MLSEEAKLTALKGVGEEMSKKLARLGVRTLGDLVNNFPRRYDDFSHLTKISKIRPGAVTIQAKISGGHGRYARRGMHVAEAIASDGTASTRLVWFNQPYRLNSLKNDEEYFISGKYELRQQRFAILNPNIELVSDFPTNTARILPIYRETKGLSSKQIRRLVHTAFDNMTAMPEILPAWLKQNLKLMDHGEALRTIHFPENVERLAQAQHTLGFEEVFTLTLASLLNKYELLADAGVAIPFRSELAQQFVAELPFKLTDAQRKVIWRIYQDLQRATPMNRLIEGDVGSGKTVVATMAALMPLAAEYQVALLAPTDLLSRQHFETIKQLLSSFSWQDTVAFLSGSMTARQKAQEYERINEGKSRFIIGTHALLQEKVDWHQLGLVIVDEQHRFGVEQRKKLLHQAGHMPHLLSLTATPIPRSLALTVYGELDVSILDTKPPGRQPIETRICSPNSRAQLYDKIKKQLDAGRQMFVVCPLITESEFHGGRSVEQVYAEIKGRDFKNYRVGLLHGKLKAAEKQRVMQQFAAHELDILVSTTVIEVGVDVPNASIMLIEAANFFGLAQIHQLRGRVGRGGHAGFCYLMMSDSSAPPARLRALENVSDGFKLAELDLKLRGPGAIYGSMQHGKLDLRIAEITDIKLISNARTAAQEFIDRQENLLEYEELNNRVAASRTITSLN